MLPTSPPRRRWFQFGLGTLFAVMTVVGAILAYYLNWIHERHAALSDWDSSAWGPLHVDAPAKAPGLLGLFGERGYGCLWKESSKPLSEAEKAQLARAECLFPEATVLWMVEP
ncbi:MAG: hypothetical protein HYX69_22990 [Planctomycetia bacterium]|nr:hypothetical protein [Planctomycetia bacterium]